MSASALFLAFYLAAALLAFGGIYSWSLAPLLGGAMILAGLATRHGDSLSSDTRALDLAILALIAAVILQVIPMPPAARLLLSPNATAVEQALRPDAPLRQSAAGSLSIDPAATTEGIILMLAVALTYWGARHTFNSGGVRFVCQALAVVGAIAAVGALAQRMWSPRLIYGFWPPEDPGALPFGPVVNRNHFAAWLLMASAVTGGYVLARIARRADAEGGWRGLVQTTVRVSQSTVLPTVTLWLIVTVTVVASQSRSAVVGMAVSGITLLRGVANSWRPVVAAATAVTALGVLLVLNGESTATRLADRFAGTLTTSAIDRSVIWRETLPIVRDFGLTGTGIGSFERAMLTYQHTRVFVPHLRTEWHFNQAHNHYLQAAAEGGLLVMLPLMTVGYLFTRCVLRRLRQDDGELRTVRLGAVAGLVGVAVQSIWEVPLTMPAAALLAAALAALATYRRRHSRLRHFR